MSRLFFHQGVLLAERADWIFAVIALHAQAAMPQFSQFPASDTLSPQYPGKDQIEDGSPSIHAARGNAQNRNQFRVQSSEFRIWRTSYFEL